MVLTLFLLGEFALAREHVEHGLILYHSQEHCSPAGKDMEVNYRSFAAWSLWMLGYPDQALQRMHDALRLARERASSFYVLAENLNLAACFHLFRKEGHIAQERAEQSIALCTEHGFAYNLALGTLRRGEALARQGHIEEGIVLMRQGWIALQATGAEGALANVLVVLAEAYGEVGQAAEGLSLLAEALTHVDKTGERFYEAELYRIKGQLTLTQSSVQRLGSSVKTKQKAKSKRQKSPAPSTQAEAEAEACFLKAIEIARQQQAKSWELRATVSLARLWQQQGKKAEARHLLAEIYGWFTEGFDTVDLQEVKVLLEELA